MIPPSGRLWFPIRASSFVLWTLVPVVTVNAGRRHVAAQRPAARAAEDEVRLRADGRLARTRAESLGALQQRRLRRLRLARRPGHDQPPRRRRRLQKLSPKDKDYYRDGFYARSRDEELKCPDLELNVLQAIEDVTARGERGGQAGA